MSYYGANNRSSIEAALGEGGMRESEIVRCDIEGLEVEGVEWYKSNMEEVNGNGMKMRGVRCVESEFVRVGLLGSEIEGSEFEGVRFNGVTLIKSEWRDVLYYGGSIRNSTMQRSVLENVRFVGSVLSEYEGMKGELRGCVFMKSVIEVSYGSGMNGSSGSCLKNCVFYGCDFRGSPMSGAVGENCVFVGCNGEIGEMEGEYMINPEIAEMRDCVGKMSEREVRENLVLALSEGVRSSVAAEEGIGGMGSFSEVIRYLKRRYDFEELEQFETESEKVYVRAGDRRMLLNGGVRMDARRMDTRRNSSSVHNSSDDDGSHGDENRSDENRSDSMSGRFRQLEL